MQIHSSAFIFSCIYLFSVLSFVMAIISWHLHFWKQKLKPRMKSMCQINVQDSKSLLISFIKNFVSLIVKKYS